MNWVGRSSFGWSGSEEMWHTHHSMSAVVAVVDEWVRSSCNYPLGCSSMREASAVGVRHSAGYPSWARIHAALRWQSMLEGEVAAGKFSVWAGVQVYTRQF